mgnify:CR=1 FL=1
MTMLETQSIHESEKAARWRKAVPRPARPVSQVGVLTPCPAHADRKHRYLLPDAIPARGCSVQCPCGREKHYFGSERWLA